MVCHALALPRDQITETVCTTIECSYGTHVDCGLHVHGISTTMFEDRQLLFRIQVQGESRTRKAE